jgi:hypothetical protein
MGVLSRFRRRRTPYRAVSEEERIARYLYLLNTLPASVIESAHAAAFREVPPQRRREMFEQLRPFMADSERDAASDDPTVLARLVRRAEEHRARRAAGNGADAATAATATATRLDVPWVDPRDGVDVRGMLASSGVMLLMANNVLASCAVVSYYTVGAGSLQLESEPGWVGETFDPGTGFDGGAAGAGDFGGADGGMGGGFDGGLGGFGGGGFDGGGGFGG